MFHRGQPPASGKSAPAYGIDGGGQIDAGQEVSVLKHTFPHGGDPFGHPKVGDVAGAFHQNIVFIGLEAVQAVRGRLHGHRGKPALPVRDSAKPYDRAVGQLHLLQADAVAESVLLHLYPLGEETNPADARAARKGPAAHKSDLLRNRHLSLTAGTVQKHMVYHHQGTGFPPLLQPGSAVEGSRADVLHRIGNLYFPNAHPVTKYFRPDLPDSLRYADYPPHPPVSRDGVFALNAKTAKSAVENQSDHMGKPV